jgi:hypothetical protein
MENCRHLMRPMAWLISSLPTMADTFPPLQCLLVIFAGWVHRQQLDVIDYLKEENRVPREMLGHQRATAASGEEGQMPGPSGPE